MGSGEMLLWRGASLKLACVPRAGDAKMKTSVQLFYILLHYMQIDLV